MSLFAEREFQHEAPVHVDEAVIGTALTPLKQQKPSRLQAPSLQAPDGQAQMHAPNLQNPSLQTPKTPSLQIPCAAIGAVFGAADAGAIILASLLGAGGYQLFLSGVPWNLDFHIGAGISAAVLYLLIGRSSGFYQPADLFSLRRNTSRIVWQWFLTSLLLALLAFLFRIGIEFSRGSIICFAVLALVSLFASRSLMKLALGWALRHKRVQGRRVVMVGLRDELAAVGQSDLLRRFGLTEVERVAFPNHGNWSLAGNKGILASLDKALVVARDRGAEEIGTIPAASSSCVTGCATRRFRCDFCLTRGSAP